MHAGGEEKVAFVGIWVPLQSPQPSTSRSGRHGITQRSRIPDAYTFVVASTVMQRVIGGEGGGGVWFGAVRKSLEYYILYRAATTPKNEPYEARLRLGGK